MSRADPSQLGLWFDAYAASLVLYARQWLSATEAEDAVQDAFVRLMGQPRSPDQPKAWLFRTVRNAALDRVRSRRRRRRRELERQADRPIWFERRQDDLIDVATAQAALEALPAEQREIIVLRTWAEMTFQEASSIVGEPVSTLHSRYKAGLSAIRRRLSQHARAQSSDA